MTLPEPREEGLACDREEDTRRDGDERLRFRFKLSQLRALSAVAEAGSVNEAARRLGVHESTLGTALRTLESQLGIQLLQRGPGGRRLSTRGARFLPLAGSVLAAADDVDAAIARLRNCRGTADAAAGAVRIAAVPSAVELVAALMANLRRVGRCIPIELDEVDQAIGLRRLRTGACDLLVAPIPDDEQAGFVRTAFAGLPFRALLSVDHELARPGSPVSWHNLRQHTVLLLDADGITGRCLGVALARHGLGGQRFSVRRYQASLEADLRAGVGVGVLATHAGTPLTGDRLVFRALTTPAIALPLSLAGRACPPLSRQAREVHDRLIEWARGFEACR